MLIIPANVLLDIQSALVAATHALVDQDGNKVVIGTIDDRRLASAAHAALLVAVGDVVWPSDKRIDPPAPRRGRGPFGDWAA